jgi:energy-coupling factor transporter ATP-binding protein EcfA2
VLLPYESFIKGDAPSKWIGWQIKGNAFLKDGDTCPYCATELPEQEQKDTALAVSKEYNATAVDNLNTLKAVIERLGKYFSAACQENLGKIVMAKFELTPLEKSFLSGLKTGITALIEQLEGLREMSFYSLRGVDKIEEKLQSLKINLGMSSDLDSEETRNVVNPINDQLDELLKTVETLKIQVGKHKTMIKKTIVTNQMSINGFLRSAGYRYTVSIVEEPSSYKMKLEHEDLGEHLEMASKHLSYGERNAFALVLFMHEVNSKNPDIVILDDPISSFDKNKKFAILHQLFRGDRSLKNVTTLMLTHDLEPAIDVVKSTVGNFAGAHPQVTFLSSKLSVVKEIAITKTDLKTFASICSEIVSSDADNLIKAIYLRRHYEITDSVELEYNLLANLFKKRELPTVRSATEDTRLMTADERDNAEESIKEKIPDFDYDALLVELNDSDAMMMKYKSTNVGYEKIQLFRHIKGKHDDKIITKFINESYHIENEYVMQLDPRRFDSIPEYVVIECDNALAEG